MIFRSITFHISLVDGSVRDIIEAHVSLLGETADRIKNSTGYSVDSLRISMPMFSGYGLLREAMRAAEPHTDGVLFSGFPIDSRQRKRYDVPGLLVENGFYTSIHLLDPLDSRRIGELLYSLSLRDPLFASRIGVELSGCPPVTPYFPLSYHKGPLRSFSTVSLLYNSDIIECLLKGEGIANCFHMLSELYFMLRREWPSKAPPLLGVDYSLSPWMDNSTARVIERVGKCVIGEHRCFNAIKYINSILESISVEYGGVGFNEVMLPLAEDDILKKRASEGRLNVNMLIHYTAACLAGLDMVALRTTPDEIGDLILHLHAISHVKRRSMGLRIISFPIDFEKDKVFLGEFGEVPVL